jgi:hypothetical protein
MLLNINKSALPDNDIVINISLVANHCTTDLYIDTLRRLLVCFDEQYMYRYNIYNNTPQLENKLKEIVSNDMFIHNNNNKISDNILDIKRQVDTIFSKYLPVASESLNENTEGLDLDLMDKITPLVPEGKEILLKNIVKEVNGSAKGLSDFVIMFTKYRQSIIKHNSIEYFQRKGCHFLRKI